MKKKAVGSRHSAFRFILSAILYALSAILLFSGCQKQDRLFKKERNLMHTFVTITVVSNSEKEAEKAIDAGFDEIKRLEGLLNYFSPESELSAINRAAGKSPVKVSPSTLDAIRKALYISGITGGAFDPAIGPVIKLWKFSEPDTEHVIPSKDVIANALKVIDYKKIKINEAASEIYLEAEGMELDLGGIAKGYAADKAIDVIKAKGIKAALVAIAGDIRGYGLKPDGEAWRVGVQNPRPKYDKEPPSLKKGGEGESPDEILTSLYLADKAISTSGDYERFFTKEGKRYHHIIDPRTGYPSDSKLISVSVIAPHGYVSDGISTGIFVLGAQKGIALLEFMGLDGIMVDSDMKVYLTRGLKGKVEIPAGFR
ncbi:MAG: FAD:protein FMN transferase [Nitrospirae bacterium]|nr:FAD:protein FMN transferase [Nitrospirota bacterium]